MDGGCCAVKFRIEMLGVVWTVSKDQDKESQEEAQLTL